MSKQTIRVWRASSVSLGIALLLCVLGWVSLNQAAFAASDEPLDELAVITVNTTNPAIIDDSLCSVVEAIENANKDMQVYDDCPAGVGNDTISLPNDAAVIFTVANNSIGGGNALPVITSTITIRGNGATFIRDTNSAPSFRFFNVAAGANLTLNELGLRNGLAVITGTTQLLLGGGAIVNQGTLRIVDSNLSYNHASFGGAIYSQPITGSLSLNNTTFSFNSADINGGAIYNFGPATITGGMLRYNTANTSGGAILHDSSTLTISNTTVLDNVADNGGGIAARAVLTDSHLMLLASDVISNGAELNGGGLYNTASNGLTSLVEVDESTFTANSVDTSLANEGNGGGIVNGWTLGNTNGGVAKIVVVQSTLIDNVAQNGGGIANLDVTGFTTRTAQIVLSQSTLTRNTAVGIGSARGSGGGLFNSNGAATVVNSTVSGNQAVGDDALLGGRGGGIGNIGRGITTTLSVLNSTVAFNEASQAGGGIADMRQVTTTPTSMAVGNTLIVSNVLTVTQSVSNALVLASIASPQVITGTESCSVESSTSTSLGGNIEDGATCGLNTAADLQNALVVLGALADNGGPTLTHMITETGPANDSGVNALCTAAPVNAVDQRGVVRPQDERCDIGAVELDTVEPETPVIYFPQIYKFYNFQ